MTDTLFVRGWAARYIALGWAVIPLKPNSKEIWDARFDMRSKLRLTPEDFNIDAGIGIRSVDGIVISDADTPEAVALADAFLPLSSSVWGRATKPRAKRVYRCEGLDKTLAFKNAEGKNIIELRVNHQDVAPPSIHASGELTEWQAGPAPVNEMEAEPLLRAHRLLATACVIVNGYPASGARHEWGLALCGLMRSVGLTEPEVTHLFEAIATLTGEPKLKDRLLEVRTTFAKGEDVAVAGGRALEEHSSKTFVRALRKIWGAALTSDALKRIESLNSVHATLFQQSGDFVVLTTNLGGDGILRFSKPQVMGLLYPDPVQVGTNLRGDPVYRPLGDAWLKHPNHRAYRGIELSPNGTPGHENYYNLWQGWSVEPKRIGTSFGAGWPLYREHIDLIGEHNEEYVRYILAWMAETVQHPDRPIGVSLAFRGEQGTGKSTFAKWFGSLFGVHFLHLDSEQRLLGRFNAHLHHAIIVLADEAVWAGGKQGLGALKRMITEDTLAIERKGIDTVSVKNMIHMMVASNEDWFVPASFDDRRFAVFRISQKRQGDAAFFGAVHEELFKKGGLAALLWDLLYYNGDVNLRLIPNTGERKQQQQQGQSPRDEWWCDVLEGGDFWHKDARIEQSELYRIDRGLIYEHYLAHTERANRWFSPGAKGDLGRYLQRVMPDELPRTYQQKSTGKRFWIFPNLEICRKFWESKHGTRGWEPATEVELLAERF